MNDNLSGIVLQKGTALKEYIIDSHLGKGGFAITYLAHDSKLNSTVVIKELLPDGIAIRKPNSTLVTHQSGSEDDFRWAIDAFLREAQTIASFEHPNIVRVIRLFEDNGTAYIVMPFIKGKTLKQILEDHGQMPHDDVISIFKPILKGLKVVHDSGILHRDIKPDNIFITNNQEPILIDFGSARLNDIGSDQDVTSMVSMGYSPIEQYSTESKYQGIWSDIYAIAASFYHAVTGVKPPPACDRNDAFRHRTPDPMKPLTSYSLPDYSDQFINGLTQGLKMNEAERPQTVEEFYELLFGESATTIRPIPLPANNSTVQSETKPKKTKSNLILITFLLMLICGVGYYINSTIKPEPKNIEPKKLANFAKENAPIEEKGSHINPYTEFNFSITLEDGDIELSPDVIANYLNHKDPDISWKVISRNNRVAIKLEGDTEFPVEATLALQHLEPITFTIEKGKDIHASLKLKLKPLYMVGLAKFDSLRYIPNLETIQDIKLRDFLKSVDLGRRINFTRLETSRNIWSIPVITGDVLVSSNTSWKFNLQSDAIWKVFDTRDRRNEMQPPESGLLSQDIQKAESSDSTPLFQFNLAKEFHPNLTSISHSKNVINEEKSFGWAKIAAARNNKDAMFLLGTAYEEGIAFNNGRKMSKDLIKARMWFNKAANLGSHEAQETLGRYYQRGRGGLTKDFQKAKEWFEKSKDGGLVEAYYGLGMLYLEEANLSTTTAQNRDAYNKKGVSLLKTASAHYSADANYNLGVLHYNGENGIVSNHLEAVSFFLKAAKEGMIEARKNLDAMTKGHAIEVQNAAKKAIQELDQY